MAKQDDYVKTQIRIPVGLHSWLKEYAEKNNLSLNETMNLMMGNGLFHHHDNEESIENKELLLKIINFKATQLSVVELQPICDILEFLTRSKNL